MAIGIGGMIGAGIFSILGVVAQAAGNGMWISFLLGGMVALPCAYSYAKLGVRYPSAGGAVEFLVKGFGDGVLSGGINLYMWIGYVIALALYAQGFVGYALTFLPAQPPAWVPKGIGVVHYLVVHRGQFHRGPDGGPLRNLYRGGQARHSGAFCGHRGVLYSFPEFVPPACCPPGPVFSLGPECCSSATKASDW